MLIRKLRLSGFRNLKDQIVEFSEGKTALVLGDNGQGKSSLIEAIWLFSCAKSFRGAADSDMIAFGRDEASLKALVDCEGVEMQIGIRLSLTYALEAGILLLLLGKGLDNAHSSENVGKQRLKRSVCGKAASIIRAHL